MKNTTTPHCLRRSLSAAALAIALVAGAVGCSTDGTTDEPAGASPDDASAMPSDSVSLTSTSASETAMAVALFDPSIVHSIEIEFDEEAYDDMIATFETTGDKDWIEATITIDGTTIDDVGLRLKGNSSLFGLTTETAQNPEDLPWLVRFDKYVDDQTHQGYADLVIRSNSTETAMNEAVALELLGLTGLATQQAIATSFTVNGGDTELRLAVEHPDEIWEASNFDSDESALYKADSEGDYSYRGDDPDEYDDVFDQKAGDDDLEPLMDFLEFLNNSDDATFAAELADRLDVEAFATYLAFQDLVDNFDDIDGPGNNSYLHYDYETERFTVVNWDLNLAFGTANVGGGPRGAGPGAGIPGGAPADGAVRGGLEPPEGFQPPDGLEPPVGFPPGAARPEGAAGPGGLGGNVLVERFLAVDEFAQLYADATAELTESLYSSGAAEAIIERWVELFSSEAAELVDVTTIRSEADAILNVIPSV